MDVKSAIALMAKNPSVNFPWEGVLIGLVNGFLPEESQLDLNTATGEDVSAAISTLDPSLQEMVYTSHIGPGQVASSAPTAPAVPAPQPPSAPLQNNAGDVVATRNTVFKMLGVTICIVALYWAMTLGGAEERKDVMELLKIGISLMSDKAPPTDTSAP